MTIDNIFLTVIAFEILVPGYEDLLSIPGFPLKFTLSVVVGLVPLFSYDHFFFVFVFHSSLKKYF